ncbi:MAG: polysaccharide biosynthesis protein [Phycisphaeraceae bacterium]|nr:polysaccharide biosynthesis protein [Phycisphaeraceae bacterium]
MSTTAPSQTPLAPRRVLIVGTLETAAQAADALLRHARATEPVGILLVGEEFAPGTIMGLPIFDASRPTAEIIDRHRIDGALVCLEPGDCADAIIRQLERSGLSIRRMPTIAEILGAAPAQPQRRQVNLSQLDLPRLVGRSPRPIDGQLATRIIRGRRVLITGAGGSIGSELVRQVAALHPQAICLVERSENALFEIDRETGRRWPNIERRALLHDVVDAAATRRIVGDWRPNVIFHAAAHKHVPMMENHPAHAVDNNLFGTISIADAAVACGVDRFVMISTDKAVNPSSVMGATKRLAERYVRSLAAENHSTRLCMVRFGNVLGSSGSVLQIWAKQIDDGGPVTVTDPRMTRYFMTIPEAAALVIESGALDESESGGADVFVLDMGEPVRILDLARRFIEACGMTPTAEPVVAVGVTSAEAGQRLRERAFGDAMPILITGARPGEKRHEELAHQREQLRPTRARGVQAWAGEVVDSDDVRSMVEDLASVRAESDQLKAIEAIARWTPTLPNVATRVIARTNIAGVA